MRVAGRLAAEVLDMIKPHIKPGINPGTGHHLSRLYREKQEAIPP